MTLPQKSSRTSPSLIIIVPTHNEASVISQTLAALVPFFEKELNHVVDAWKIIVADNGSNNRDADTTRALCGVYSSEKVEYIYISDAGRGFAFREVIRRYPTSFFIAIDADVPLELADIPRLLEPIRSGNAAIAIGKRIGKRPLYRALMTRGWRWFLGIVFDLTVEDAQCGALAFDARTASLLLSGCRETGWLLNTELLLTAAKENLPRCEVPIRWIEQRYPNRRSTVSPVRYGISALSFAFDFFRRRYPSAFRATLIFIGMGSLFILFCLLEALAASNSYTLILAFRGPKSDTLFFSLFVFGAVLSLAPLFFRSRFMYIPWRLSVAIVIGVFCAVALIAVVTHPTQSQDAYWNLLLVNGFARDGLNPYHTTPSMLANDPWAAPVVLWRDLQMTFGPAWVLLLVPITLITQSLASALVLMKLFAVGALVASGLVLWKILAFYPISNKQKAFLMAVLAWNPFVVQTVIIDAHNDVYIMLAVLVSYLFFLRKRFVASTVALIVGGFFKYIPWFLIPIPLIFMLFEEKRFSQAAKKIGAIAAIFVVLCFIFYAPFGSPTSTLVGVSKEFTERGTAYYSLPGSALISSAFNVSAVRLIGLLLSLVILVGMIVLRRSLMAYILPICALLFFGTPWFTSWYLLWIFPLLAVVLSPGVFIALSVFAFICTSFAATEAVLLFLGFVVWFFIVRFLLRKLIAITHTHPAV